jgi:hypothetical protein
MIQLNNLTPFEEFKKMYEAVNLGTEFSNTTGLKESLLGRGIFGLFRMIKKGINAVRLEYFKRRLENEYLAGLLRYCKTNNIDLKNPQALSDEGKNVAKQSSEVEQQRDQEMKELLNDILSIKFDTPDYKKILTETKNEINKNITEITSSGYKLDQSDQDLIEQFKKVNELIDSITIICDNFISLKTEYKEEHITNIINSVKKMKVDGLNYTASGSEKALLDTHKAEQAVQNLLSELNAVTKTTESILNEKVGNSPVGIDFILGDELSTEGVGEFLNKQGVNNVNDINFVQLSKVFNDKMKENATKHVNQNAIMRVQHGVSAIIYHKTTTPDDRGMNPGTGGGIDTAQPTALYKPWQIKVQKILGEFSPFLNVTAIDPFKLNMSNYNLSEDPGSKKLKSEDEKTKEMDRLFKISKLGPTVGITEDLKKFGMIRLFRSGKFYGPVFKLEETKGQRVYEYVGSVNIDNINKDLETLKKLDDPNTQKYETPFGSKTKNGLVPEFLSKIIHEKQTMNSKDLVGVYFIFENIISSPSSGEHRTNKARIFFLYFKHGAGKTFTSTNIPEFEIYGLNKDGSNMIKIDLTKLNSIEPFEVGVGQTFEFSDECPLKKDFSTQINNVGVKFLDLSGVSYK